MADQERPLSPHLTVYRWHVTMTLSILHRITGVALGAGIMLLAGWLISAASGPEAFESVNSFLGGFFGRLILFAFTISIVLHFLNGIRHLVWDMGVGLEKGTATVSGWLVVAGTVILTFLIWIIGYAVFGAGA